MEYRQRRGTLQCVFGGPIMMHESLPNESLPNESNPADPRKWLVGCGDWARGFTPKRMSDDDVCRESVEVFPA